MQIFKKENEQKHLVNVCKLVSNQNTRNATRCNNRDYLLHLSFTLKLLIFSDVYIYNPDEPLW